MTKVLITGGGGFVGSAVISALKTYPALELHATCLNESEQRDEHVCWHKADLLEPAAMRDLFQKIQPTILIQLAWCSGHGTYWTDPANKTWVAVNDHLARCFADNGGEACLFAGTSAEYDWTSNEPLCEDTSVLRPVLVYGSSKLASYHSLSEFFEEHNIRFLWARFFNPFGEGEDPRRLIPKICLRLLNGETIEFDSGLTLRDFLEVGEVGRAVAAALFSDCSGAINIASGEARTVRSIIEDISDHFNLREKVSFADAKGRKELQDMVVADISKLRASGWQPTKNFSTHLADTCDWWRQQYKKQTEKK